MRIKLKTGYKAFCKLLSYKKLNCILFLDWKRIMFTEIKKETLTPTFPQKFDNISVILLQFVIILLISLSINFPFGIFISPKL